MSRIPNVYHREFDFASFGFASWARDLPSVYVYSSSLVSYVTCTSTITTDGFDSASSVQGVDFASSFGVHFPI